ncbi:MAG: response regulator [Candidatus Omnitrophota bacterium]|nr:MAG: response regulator [Candidatus Omnitrophota bacterium]
MTKILIVDDEIDVCDFVKHFFEDRNFRTFAALDGEEALRILKKEKPDIILLDIRMKKMDGIETLKKIREIDKDVKVIMITAVNEQDKMEICHKLGAFKYITKPLILEELERVVCSHGKKDENVS